jgi:4-oxalocrotonate tautomerase
MPIIVVNMVEGRTDKQKEDLIKEITKGAAKALSEPEKAIQVIINDVSMANWGIEGIQFSKRGHTH